MKETIKIAYQRLNRQTPLRVDCGSLCQAACCQGDLDTGMYLFPHEEKLLRTVGFLCISPTELETDSGRRILLATCPGECDRNLRPLSCRLFPLTPYLSPAGDLEIKIDPRAKAVCPLARNISIGEMDPDFVQAVNDVCRLLLEEKEGREFILALSQVLDEYENSDFLGLL